MNAKTRVVTLDDEPESPPATTAPLPAAEAGEGAPVVRGTNADDQLSGRKARILIQEGDADADKLPVFCALNGYAYQIPRGVEVSIPVEVLEVLNNAVMTRFDADGGKVVSRDVARFNLRVFEAD